MSCRQSEEADLETMAGEAEPPDIRVVFDRRLKLEFHGSRAISDDGLLAFPLGRNPATSASTRARNGVVLRRWGGERSDSFERHREPANSGGDDIGGPGPDEGSGGLVVLVDVAAVGVLRAGDGGEDAASDAPACDRGEEPFDGIEPGRGNGNGMEHPARIIGEPLPYPGMLEHGVVVADGMDDPADRHGALRGVEEPDEFRAGVPDHAATGHGAVENVGGGEDRGGAVAHVAVGRGSAIAGFARPVAQQPVDTRFGKTPLPAPDRSSAHAGLPGHLNDRRPIRGERHDLRPLNMLPQAIPISDNRSRTRAVIRCRQDANGLCHAPRPAWLEPSVNPASVSPH